MAIFQPNKNEYTVDQWPVNRTLPLTAEVFGNNPCPVCGAPNSTCTGREMNHASTTEHHEEPVDALAIAKAFILADGGTVEGIERDQREQFERESDSEVRRPNDFFIEF